MNAYQFSTMNALMLGHYESAEKVKDALEHGLVGIGTYEGLNGEAIIIDGCAYNGLPGGEIKQMDVETGMAFGIVAPVQMMGTVFQQKSVLNLVSLKERADEVRKAECKSDNFICFARIDGVLIVSLFVLVISKMSLMLRCMKLQKAKLKQLEMMSKEHL